MKKILVLGGTHFIGRALVEELVKTEHSVTLFNRGKSNPGLFSELKQLHGDRETADIKQIFNQDWDIVYDISGYYPLTIEKMLDGLKGKVGRYIFVSTISVYDLDKFANQNIIEETETVSCSEEQKTNISMKTYGERKAECERVILSKEWLEQIILRPSLVYGKYDYTDRFYYWLYRVNKLSQVLIPDLDTKGNYTFVDDMVNIMLSSMEINKPEKIYNTTTHEPVYLTELLKIIEQVGNYKPEYIKVSEQFRKDNNIQPWADFPLWIDSDLLIDNSKVKRDFPKLQSFEESVKKTYDYYDSLGWYEGKYGLSLEKEKELIKKAV